MRVLGVWREGGFRDKTDEGIWSGVLFHLMVVSSFLLLRDVEEAAKNSVVPGTVSS